MITITNKIQSQEYLRDSGVDGVMYTTDSDSNPFVFYVKRNDDKPWLNTNWTNSDNRWNLDNEIVFRLRKCVYFSLAPAGEFRFTSCPYQPPSIFPTVSIFSEISA